jgi:pimeloyl-ACP methyl ester carboxylesterase
MKLLLSQLRKAGFLMRKNQQTDSDPDGIPPERREVEKSIAYREARNAREPIDSARGEEAVVRSRRWSTQAFVRESITVVLLLALFLVRTSQTSGHQNDGGGGGGSPNIAMFQPASCPFNLGEGLVEGQQVNCGFVRVPENREINDGKTVNLAVVIFKAPQYMHSTDPSPMLRIDGGPGESSLDASAHFITTQNYKSFIFDHDLIMFDQRGVGYSTPSIACPEVVMSATNMLAINEKTARACHDRLVSEGINLNNFNVLQNAADVADLIHALGYRQMTLYGVSYGTRLVLTVMRLHPEVVRAVVLDSVYPPNHNRNELTSAAQRAFTLLFQRCAANAYCNAKYPNLQRVFYNLVDQLNAHPINFIYTVPGTQRQYTIPSYTGDTLISTIYGDFYIAATIPLLPDLIFQAKAQAHDHLPVRYGSTSGPVNWGMFFSTECSEDWPFLTQQDISNSRQGVTPQIARVLGGTEQAEYNICQFWKVQTVPIAQKQPVFSNIPTLVLAGEYDQITPPSSSQEVANNLSHSYYILFPGVGHGVLYQSTCANQIVSAFENHPEQQPDSSCLAQMSARHSSN